MSRSIVRFRKYMTQTISVAERTGVDGYGKPTYGAYRKYPAHLVNERKLWRSADGQQVVSELTAYLMSADLVSPTAKVLLSTAETGTTEAWALSPAIAGVERHADESGPHHTILRLRYGRGYGGG